MMEEQPQPSLSELIISLEQATFMAKQLSSSSSSNSNSNSTNPTHLHQIHNSLHQAHHHLTAFLSTLQSPPPPENSVSSANGAVPMQLADDDDDEEEETSKCTIDRVEQKLRDCFIKNKRPKRPLSPSTVAQVEEKRFSDDGFVKDYDSHAIKLRALDLVYQFHG